MLRSPRKIVPILVSSLLAFALIPMTATSSQAVAADGFRYSVFGKTATLERCDGLCPEALNIPSTVPGMSQVSVTSIGRYAFASYAETRPIYSVTLPATLTSIQEGAFRGLEISNTVVLPSKLSKIEKYAFDSTKIYEIKFNNALTSIGVGAFQGSEISIQPSLQMQTGEISSNAFRGISFASVSLGSNFTSVGSGAFARGISSNTVPNIGALTIGGGHIGIEAFQETNIGSITLGSGVETIGARAFAGPNDGDPSTRGALSISAGVIEENAFKNSSFSRVTIGKSVVSIASGAFEETNTQGPVAVDARVLAQRSFAGATMNSLIVGTNVGSIGFGAFGGSEGPYDLGEVLIKGGSFSEAAFMEIEADKTSISSTVKRVNPDAFSDSNLGDLFVDAQHVGEGAFFGSGATSLTFGPNLKSIGPGAFGQFQMSGTSRTVTLNVETIGSGAFANTNLTEVTLGTKVRLIDEEAFRNSAQLVSVVVNAGVIEENAFSDSGIERLVLGSGVTRIERSAFSSNAIDSLDFANGATSIGANAFSGLGELQSIKIPNSVSYIGGFAFSSSPDLKNVSFGNGLKYLEEGAFSQVVLERVNFFGPPPLEVSGIPLEPMELHHTAGNATTWSAKFLNTGSWGQSGITRISELAQPTLTYTSATNDKPTASKIAVKANYSMSATGTVEIKVTQSGSKTVLCSAKVQTRLLSGVAKCDLSKKIRDGLKKKALTLNVALTYSPDLGDVQKPVSKSLALKKQ